MTNSKISFDYVKCSTRIRSLRVDRKESHAKLGETVGVSEQTLKNYDQAAIYNGVSTGQDRVTKIAGMSINTLCSLADHFGVSTDYLLGRTDIPTCDVDIQTACKTTGLSEKAVEAIAKHRDIQEALNDFLPAFGSGFCWELLNVKSTTQKAAESFDSLKAEFAKQGFTIRTLFESLSKITDSINLSLFSFEKYCRHLPQIYGSDTLENEIESFTVDAFNRLGGVDDGKRS